MKVYEAPHAQIVSFENDYVATAPGGGDASTTGLLWVTTGSCEWSNGDHILAGCGSAPPSKQAS